MNTSTGDRNCVLAGEFFWREMCEISTFDGKFLAVNVDFGGKTFDGKIWLCFICVYIWGNIYGGGKYDVTVTTYYCRRDTFCRRDGCEL